MYDAISAFIVEVRRFRQRGRGLVEDYLHQFDQFGLKNPSSCYNETLLTQARMTAACNISHPIEARFCRWLLQSRDRAESDTVPLTQEFFSEMLGVRRTSVSEVAVKMQEAGAISYSRGIIKIVNLQMLREISCECYETLRDKAS